MSAKVRLLFTALESTAASVVGRYLASAELTVIDTLADFEAKLDSVTDQAFDLIICGTKIPELSGSELAQTFRVQAPSARIFFIPDQVGQVDFKGLVKNGYDEVFLLPVEEKLLASALRQVERDITGVVQKVYAKVPAMDFEAGTELDFGVSIHMPMNNKYVQILKSGGKVEAQHIERFKKHQVTTLSVEEGELDKFVTYSVNQMKKYSRESTHAGKTKLQNTVRELFRTLISTQAGDFNDGKSLIENSQKIVAEFVNTKPLHSARDQIMTSLGSADNDMYAHCGRVSNLAALLCLGTGTGVAQEAAIAGLFHDLGKIRLPIPLQKKDMSEMTPDELKEFHTFPAHTLTILQEKRIGISQKVRNAIQQQGERADGRGFPKNLPEHKLEPETFILHIANRLDELMMPRPGLPTPKLEDALEIIAQSSAVPFSLINAIKKFVAAAPATSAA